jgi:hypothetical protein
MTIEQAGQSDRAAMTISEAPTCRWAFWLRPADAIFPRRCNLFLGVNGTERGDEACGDRSCGGQ